ISIESYEQVIHIYTPGVNNQLLYKDIIELRKAWDQKGKALFVRWGEGKLLIIDQYESQEKLRQKLERFQIEMAHILGERDRKSTRLNSSHVSISYAVFCLKKKK